MGFPRAVARAAAGLLVTMLAAALGFVAVAVAAEAPAPADGCAALQYVTLLHESLAALREDPPDPVRARAPLAGLVAVSGPGVLGPVLAALDGNPPDLPGATRRLAALTGVLDLPAGSGCHIDPRPARDVLRHVYASRAFAELDRGESHSFLEDAGTSLLRALAGVAGRVHPGALAVLLVILLGGLAALGARAWRRLPAAAATRPQRKRSGSGSDPDREWDAALAAAAAGDHREAIRRAFRSALLTVMHRGRLDIDSSWTTGQLLARAAGDADLAATLAPAAASFDRAWYSGRPVSPADWEQASACCQAVRALAGLRRLAAVA